jgi:hypothetical protein
VRTFLVSLAVLAGALAPLPVAALEFAFATPEQGAAVLSTQDEFMAAIAPHDVALRVGSNDNLTAARLAEHYAANTRVWTPEERARLEASIARVSPLLSPYEALLPPRMLLIASTDRVDAGFAFTRGSDIVMGATLPEDGARLDHVLIHEVFHVLSRRNPARRDAIYDAVGFVRCMQITLPENVRNRILTNPDAPVVNYVFPLGESDVGVVATPVIVVNSTTFDPARPSMAQYVGVEFASLHRDAAGVCTPAAEPAPEAAVQAALQRRAGRNTGYIIHPEEIAADNFALMLVGGEGAPDQWVFERLRAALH